MLAPTTVSSPPIQGRARATASTPATQRNSTACKPQPLSIHPFLPSSTLNFFFIHSFRNDRTVLASSGFYGDIVALNKNLKVKMELYRYQHSKEMSCPAAAQMLSTVLYQKRFFPYYSFNILGGVDAEGRGAVYHFDVVGSFQRESYRADGTAQALIQPFLDNQVGFKNQAGVEKRLLTREEALRVIRDAFTAATERDIYTGDFLDVWTVTKAGTTTERFELKKD